MAKDDAKTIIHKITTLLDTKNYKENISLMSNQLKEKYKNVNVKNYLDNLFKKDGS